MKISPFTIWLLGLEKEIFQEINKPEKTKYNLVASIFILLFLIAIIAIFRFFELTIEAELTKNTIILILCFVAFSMYRFSIITFRRSVFEISFHIDTNLNKIKATEKDSSLEFVEKSKEKNTRNKIGSFFMAMFMRTLIFIPFSILIIFSVCTIINYKKINEDCTKQSEILMENNELIIQKHFNSDQKRAYLKVQEIQNLLNDKIRSKSLTANNRFEKINQIFLIKESQKKDTVNYKKELSELKIKYGKPKKYLLLIFNSISKSVLFFILLILFNILFFLVHYELYSLKTDENYQYAQLSTKAYRELISKNYQVAMDEANSFVKKYKKFELPLNYSKEAFLDPPFCQIPKYTNTPKEKIAITKLPQIINTNSQI